MLGSAPLSPKAYDYTYYAVSQHSFANYKAGYLALWKRMTVTKTADATKQVNLLIKHQAVYQRVQDATGVPWQVVGLLHLREAGAQDVGRWKGILHNGQAIVGTGRKSTIVPKGVGPFATWHEAAVDAIRQEGLNRIDWKNDLVPAVAYASEKFNGFGYRSRGMVSPYLWGGTSVQDRGKFVSDGVFDRSTMDPQIGTMALLRVIMEKTVFGAGTKIVPMPPKPAPAPVPPKDPQPTPAAHSKSLLNHLITALGALFRKGK